MATVRVNPVAGNFTELDLQRAQRLLRVATMVGLGDEVRLGQAFAEIVAEWRTEETKLGSTVVDTVTGFSGVATSRVAHLHGCARVLVEGRVTDGKATSEWVDEPRLRPHSPR